jgi:hypothetical protein
MANYTIYASVAACIYSKSGTYSSARSGTGQTLDSALNVGQLYIATFYYCFESFIGFTTSSVLGTVSSATLSAYLFQDNSTTDFTVYARLRDFGSGAVTTGDWVAGASLSALTQLASKGTSGIGSTNAYKTFTSSNLASNINTSGDTRIILTSSRHEGNNTPTGNEYVSFTLATGSANAPYLSITDDYVPPQATRSFGTII